VMLYEMLAGRLPFEGDSAVAVALKHLSEQPPPISQWRPDVHPALEAVVMAALAKDPTLRWQSAEDLSAALEAARAQIESGNNGGQDTAAFAPIPMPAGDATAATQIAGAPEPMLAPVAAPPEEREERRWPWFAIGLLTLALIGALLYVILSGALTTEKKDVPRVTGKQLVAARAVLERAGFEVQTERVRSAQPFDQVVDQDPNPGEQAEDGSTVTLEVSRGPGAVRVPAVAGLPQRQAINELQDADLKVTVDREPSDKVAEDLAIRTLPREATRVTRGTPVRLIVSSGPEQLTVPDVTGLSRDSAESRLRDEGFGVSVTEQESDETEGDVISQSPAGGTELARGETVTITVSTGTPRVDVPDVIGLRERSASSRLSSAGLKPVTQERTVTDPSQDGVVVEQRPATGTQLDKGAEVVIVIGVLEETPEEIPPTEPEVP
jgi:eukaryotic-like serine/threonine-protein kinase